MSRWRVALLVALTAAPFLVLLGFGAHALYQRGFAFIGWWVMAACLASAYALGIYWQRTHKLLPPTDFAPSLRWTDRDREAWQLVEARATRASALTADQLGEIDFYVQQAREMADELARFYHPRAADPVAHLTLPEILAVTELAAHDLAELVDRYVPGGHLLTVQNWRQARRAADWYHTASTVYWMVAALFSPVNTGLRYAASQLGLSRPLDILQQDLLIWFYTAYVHRVGTYLIDLNSGRLRVGARRFRELVRAQQPDGEQPRPVPDAAEQVARLTITLMGQVKAGKSSVINALLGEQRAKTDVLPATAEVTRYELQPEGIPTRLVFLDTVGYGHTGPREDQLRATQQAAQQSDLVFLVLHARNPARQADLQALTALKDWYASRLDLKMPPVLAVLTHIDLLSPAMEWAPPYNWQQPTRPKEQQIQGALTAVRDQLGNLLVGAVPVCAAPGKVHGVEEWLLPTLVELLDEGRAVALVRVLHAEADAAKARKVFQQLLAAGTEVAKVVLARYR